MLISDELNNLNLIMIKTLEDSENYISKELLEYLTAKSKKIRPSLLFLFAKALNINITDKIYNLACAVELVHNSTLVHDDIIDNAQTRRGRNSLNVELGNSLSVLAGDILLAAALNKLSQCNNISIVNIFSDCLYKMCKGEIKQNFTIDKLPAIGEYLKKSQFKTAELFKAPLLSLFYLEDMQNKDKIVDFANNFGVAFQIKDDLLNILKSDKTKPALSDINNGIFTAPVIFLNEDENITNLSKERITELVQNEKYINKTVELIEIFADKAIKAIEFIPDNQYKNEIVIMSENLYKVGINE